jgi:hypothetical protein
VDNQIASPEGKKTYKEWSREDVMACILSPLAYFLITVGTPLLLLNQWTGWLITFISLVVIAAMFIIIDPKLKALSEEFEKKQKGYLEELDKIIEWKSNP